MIHFRFVSVPFSHVPVPSKVYTVVGDLPNVCLFNYLLFFS